MTENQIRTRFAPSPTGFLHVGGIRTAIFAYLLAKRHGGTFILRIEDTDRERLVPGAIRGIVEDLTWLGVEIDEGPSLEELRNADPSWKESWGFTGKSGPYIQSHRLPRYKEIAQQLISAGHAYRCDCTPEMLERERELQAARKVPPGYGGRCRNRNVSEEVPHVVRLRIPDKKTVTLDDAVKGKISWSSLSLRDPVLLKSDGFPTYHLAVVVDDHDMEVSHVIRGDEWVPSAPIHLLEYEALGWNAPVFCHPPVVLGQDGKKLSKRHGATFVSTFREAGYLPEALFNFLVLIGWSPGEGEEQEIFTKQELISRFSLEHVNGAPGVFSYEKLNWMNGVYIRNLSPSELQERIRPFLVSENYSIDEIRFTKIVPHIQERMVLLKDAVSLIDFLFTDNLQRDLPAMLTKGIDAEKAKQILTSAHSKLSANTSFTKESVDQELRSISSELEVATGAMFGVVRIAVTGKKITPPLFESMDALGKQETLRRIEEAKQLL